MTMRGGRLARRRDATPWLVALVLAAYAGCVLVHLAACRFDISRFIVAGDVVVQPARLHWPIAVEAQSPGYDGQYFYRLALDPFDTRPDAYGIPMNAAPAVRAQRIVYPAAAWALSLGRGAAVPDTLVAVNLIAVALLAAVAAALARQFGVAARWGLLLPFYPGFVLSSCRDTAEIVATLLALAALLAAERRRWPAAALLAGLAVLTREATLLYLAGYGIAGLWRSVQGRHLDPAVPWCLVPLAVYLAWQAAMNHVWGHFSYEVIGHDDLAALPLADYARGVVGWLGAALRLPVRYSVLYSLVTILLVPVFVLLVLREGVRAGTTLPFAPAFAWLCYAAMAAVFTQAIWRDPWGYVRILDDVYSLGIVVLLSLRRLPPLRALAVGVGITWAASVAFVI